MLCVALASTANAQEDVLRPSIPPPILFGLELGANYNMFSQNITRSFDVPNSPYDVYGSGDGYSPYFTVYADYQANKRMGVQFKLGIDRKSFGDGRVGTADCYTNQSGSESEPLQERIDYTVSTTFITLGALARLDVLPRWFVSLGPVMHVRLDSTNQVERFEYLGTRPCEFIDDLGNPIGKVLTVEKKIQSNPSTRIGLELGTGYRIPLTKKFNLIPNIRFQYMLTDFVEDRPSADQFRRFTLGIADVQLTETTLHSIQVGMALQFGL